MFDDAIAYMAEYRTRRAAALCNEEPQQWFTDGVSTIGELFTDPFDPEAENRALAKIYTQPRIDALTLQAAQLKLDAVAGLRHDLRVQFAVGTEHAARTALDYDRHGVLDHVTCRWRFSRLKQLLAIKSKGGKSV